MIFHAPTPTSISHIQQSTSTSTSTQSLRSISVLGLTMQTALNGRPRRLSPPTSRGRMQLLSAPYRPVSKSKKLVKRDPHLLRTQNLQRRQKGLNQTMATLLHLHPRLLPGARRRVSLHLSLKATRRMPFLPTQEASVNLCQVTALRFLSRLRKN